MAKCGEAYLEMGRTDFYDHVREEVSNVANKVRYQILNAVSNDAYKYQNDVNEGPGEDLEYLRRMWKEHLGVDIATVDYSDDSNNGVIGQPIINYVIEQLEPLTDRAKTLPKPSDAQALMDVIKSKLYGPGHAGGKGDVARGYLGAAETECADIRTDEDKLLRWKSTAATTFKGGFLENTEDVVIPLQRDELNTLAHLAELNYGAILTAREDICAIAHGASTAADDMVEGCGDGADGSEEGVGAFVGMAAAALAIAAACAAGGPGIAIALGVAGGAAAGASAAAPFFESAKESVSASKSERSFAAAHWRELIEKVAEAAQEMETNLDQAYKDIGAAASRRLKAISSKDLGSNLVVSGGS